MGLRREWPATVRRPLSIARYALGGPTGVTGLLSPSGYFTRRIHQKADFNSAAKLARSGNRFERRMPKAESCARILVLASFGMIN